MTNERISCVHLSLIVVKLSNVHCRIIYFRIYGKSNLSTNYYRIGSTWFCLFTFSPKTLIEIGPFALCVCVFVTTNDCQNGEWKCREWEREKESWLLWKWSLVCMLYIAQAANSHVVHFEEHKTCVSTN